MIPPPQASLSMPVPLWLFMLSAIGNLIFMYFTMRREALHENLIWAAQRKVDMNAEYLNKYIAELHREFVANKRNSDD